MDSLTHLLVGGLTPLAFKRRPRTAALVLFGIAAGEIPDIDVLAGSSAAARLIMHRGYTHSLLAIFVFSLALAAVWSIFRLTPAFADSGGGDCRAGRAKSRFGIDGWGGWSFKWLFAAGMAAVAGHLYLDCMTTFGTRVLLPFSGYRVGFPAMFIVDPFLTVPLLIVFVMALKGLRRPERLLRQVRLARAGLVWAFVYPLIALAIGQAVLGRLNEEYSAANRPDLGIERIRVTPELFAPFVWRVVAEDAATYRLAAWTPFGGELKFSTPYSKASPELIAALRVADPIFNSYDSFVSFPTQSERALSDGGLEVSLVDLRYVPSLPRLFKAVGLGDGNYIMQVGLGELKTVEYKVDAPPAVVNEPVTARDLKTWRYLSRGKAESTSWQTFKNPDVSWQALK